MSPPTALARGGAARRGDVGRGTLVPRDRVFPVKTTTPQASETRPLSGNSRALFSSRVSAAPVLVAMSTITGPLTSGLAELCIHNLISS